MSRTLLLFIVSSTSSVNGLKCNVWQTFTNAKPGSGVPSDTKMQTVTCDASDPSKVYSCSTITYTASKTTAGEQAHSAFCTDGCTVSEGGCTDQNSCQDVATQAQMSGNDASADSGNDGVVPSACDGTKMMVAGHPDSTYNGEYAVEAAKFNGKNVYKSGSSKFLYFYNYTQWDRHTMGWALDETDPSSLNETAINIPDQTYRSGGEQDFNDNSANDGAAGVAPASCQNGCFGHDGEGILVRLYCVSGSRRLSMEERALRGEVSNLKCKMCKDDKCNSPTTTSTTFNAAVSSSPFLALLGLTMALSMVLA